MPLDADAMVKPSLGTLLGGRSEDSIFHIMRILVFVVRSRRNASMDLFTPLVEEEKLHKNFIRTIARTGGGVREVLKYWADGFADRDGKFVREFQTIIRAFGSFISSLFSSISASRPISRLPRLTLF